MKVCIAEKPSVAKEIAIILGANTKKDGYFEGNGYCVTWTFGHFCTLFTPDNYKPHWKRWDLNNLPMLPEKFETKLIENSGVQKQFNVIKNLFDKASLVINCGDAGQEGELIQRWVIKKANYTGEVQRLWISSLTPEAIKDGFENLKDAAIYDNLYYAGSSRAIGDWLLGMNATRLFTLRYGRNSQVLSVGRVQTPTLAMLVNRHKEIQNFVPQPYWELQTHYRDTSFNCEEGKFLKKEDGEALLKKVETQPFKITSVTKKKGKEYPPHLFDLTGLQVYCNNKFGLSAEQTLKTVQRLYEQKVVTYPRVDTTYLPNDIYPKVPGILNKLSQYNKYTQPILGEKIRKSSKVFNDKKVTDHHAIIPTGIERSLPANEQQIYDIITRRFIAAFYPDCITSSTTVKGESATIPFKGTGKEILDDGWRVLFSKPKKSPETHSNTSSKTGEEKIMPTFTKGESGPHTPSFIEKQTSAPKNYTEATLLRAMETAGKKVEDEELRELMKANGIGRPSTRANIIETLFKRKYIERKKKLILPTSMGIQLIDTIQNELLKSAELTGHWEKKLKEIEMGDYSAGKFIHNMKKMVSDLVVEVRMAQNTRSITLTNSLPEKNKQKTTAKKKGIQATKCPKCKEGAILKGSTSYGCSKWKENCSFRLPFEFMEKKISEKQLLRLITKGETIVLKGFKSNGQKLNGSLKFNDNFEIQLNTTPIDTQKEIKVPNPIPCPKCIKGEVIKGQTAYGCSNWKQGCNFRFDYEEVRKKASGKEMSKLLVWQILKGEV